MWDAIARSATFFHSVMPPNIWASAFNTWAAFASISCLNPQRVYSFSPIAMGTSIFLWSSAQPSISSGDNGSSNQYMSLRSSSLPIFRASIRLYALLASTSKCISGPMASLTASMRSRSSRIDTPPIFILIALAPFFRFSFISFWSRSRPFPSS